jgi:two-component system, cell cycle response regulator
MSSAANAFKVLIADDSPIYRKLVEQSLSDENCAVLFASRGLEAIEIFERERPQMVITDWTMPDLSGLELCQRIRAAGQASYTYIIIVTGHAGKDMVVQGLSSGADEYITKPFHRDELQARVRVGRRLLDLHEQIEGKNRLLEELALTDALTGLPNRRAIEEWASRQLSGAARHGFSFWAVMIDLDHFKSVNDLYGHDAGDTVLKGFAEILKASTRRSNICGRIGGEEFLQVLTHVSENSVKIVVERVREQFEAERFFFGGANRNFTASFGAAGFCGKRAPAFGELVSRADRALYRAKRLGRNRIEIESLSIASS